MKKTRKLTAILLTFLVICGMIFPAIISVSAVDEEPVEIQEIYTVEDLYMINYDLNGNYKLMNDIDLTEDTAQGGDWDFGGRGWEPIGSNGIYSGSTPFTGIFDGNGYEIKGLRINVSSLPSGTGFTYVGLFANNSGSIKNLTVSGSISASAGGKYVGTIAGYNSGTIEACANNSSVAISAYVASGIYVGGITGYTDENSVIEKCVNAAELNGTNTYNTYYSSTDKANSYTGGIAGYSLGAISECYNSEKVSSKAYGRYSSNVLYSALSSGIAYGGTITDCYNTGDISATTQRDSYVMVGGISAGSDGTRTISSCYNTGTATKAISYGTVTSCYFLNGSGEDTTGAKSLTAAQMKIERIYTGFDFENVWVIDKNSEYPYPQLKNNRQIPLLVGLEITSVPDKETYLESEEFDGSGLVVSAVYENGNKKAVTDYQLSGFDSTAGAKTITVAYGEFTAEFTVNVYAFGDANLDGKINIRDVTAIQRHAAEFEILTGAAYFAADVDGNGVVDINDATLLQMYLAEFDVVLGKQA